MPDHDTSRNVLVWHVHGSWMESFMAGPHTYLIPFSGDDRARGLMCRTWPNATELTVTELREADVDVVIVQRPDEPVLAEQWLGRRLGVDVPTVYLEHNAPR